MQQWHHIQDQVLAPILIRATNPLLQLTSSKTPSPQRLMVMGPALGTCAERPPPAQRTHSRTMEILRFAWQVTIAIPVPTTTASHTAIEPRLQYTSVLLGAMSAFFERLERLRCLKLNERARPFRRSQRDQWSDHALGYHLAARAYSSSGLPRQTTSCLSIG